MQSSERAMAAVLREEHAPSRDRVLRDVFWTCPAVRRDARLIPFDAARLAAARAR